MSGRREWPLGRRGPERVAELVPGEEEQEPEAELVHELDALVDLDDAEDVRAEFAPALMAMDEDGRAAALEMIDATAAE